MLQRRAGACVLLLLLAAAAAVPAGAIRDAGIPGLSSRGVDVADLRTAAGPREPCHSLRHRKRTLKLIKEAPFSGLFRELRNNTKFEASGLARVRGEYYAIFDNAMSIGHLDDRFRFRDPHNVLIGDWEPESQFEGIAYVPENDTFLLLHEAVEHKTPGTFFPWVREVKIAKDMSNYETRANCIVNFEFDNSNKGFESIQYIHNKHDEPAYLLGLCEGNWCEGGAKGQEKGNGRIVVSELQWKEDGSCVWEPFKTLKVPEAAFFTDYSAMAYNYETRKLAIVSQEDAAIWIGDFDGDELEFLSERGMMFHLPRDNHCQMIYCNAEGLQWVDHFRLAVASDKAKSRQPYWCDMKDQSIHLFSMPQRWDPWAAADEAEAALERELAQEEAELAASAEL